MATIRLRKLDYRYLGKAVLWFLTGAVLGFFFFSSFLYISYKSSHADKIYEGVIINNVDFGGKTKEEARKYFAKKNSVIQKNVFVLTSPDATATISAKEIGIRYDEKLLSEQAFSIGRGKNTLSNINVMF